LSQWLQFLLPRCDLSLAVGPIPKTRKSNPGRNRKISNYERSFTFESISCAGRNPNDPQDTDYTGYDFWLTKLNNFTQPGDDILVRVQKAEMVKAFIVSTEYRKRFGP
jgi:hypothetical protein